MASHNLRQNSSYAYAAYNHAILTSRYMCFQIGRWSNLDKDSSVCLRKFTHTYTRKIPNNNLNILFKENQCAIFYSTHASFQSSYYNKQDESLYKPSDFRDTSPLAVIHCTNQNDHLPAVAVVLFRLQFDTHENILVNTIVYCTVVYMSKNQQYLENHLTDLLGI